MPDLPSRVALGDDVRALVERLAPAWSGEIADWFDEHDTFRVAEGPVCLAGLDLTDALVVVGDLDVDGELVTFYESALLVLGSVRCRTMALRGRTLVTGDVRAADWIALDASNDYAATFGGTVRARLVVEHGMATFAQRFDAEVWRTMNAVVEGATGRRFDRRPHGAFTRASAAAAGLDEAAIDDLAVMIPGLA